MPNTAYAVSQSQLGAAIETTKGTLIAAGFWLPVTAPDYQPMPTENEDKGFRGSVPDVFDLIPGLRYDAMGWGGNPFLDSFPILPVCLLGSTDTTKTAPSSTTLASGSTAGGTTISATASIASGSWITIGSGSTIETHQTSGVTGSGPYTVTVATPLLYSQANGTAITGLTGHKIGTLNNASSGNQPPSLTVYDNSGEEWRALTGWQLDTLTLKGSAAKNLEYTTKGIAFASVTPSTPTPSYPTTTPVPGWTLAVSIGGTFVQYVMDYEFNFKRSTKAIPGSTGTQAYYQNFASYLTSAGKLTLIEQSGSELAAFLANTPQAMDFTWFDIATGDAMNIHMSSVKFKTGKLDRSKDPANVALDWVARPNATDVVAGGLAPVTMSFANAQTTAYH